MSHSTIDAEARPEHLQLLEDAIEAVESDEGFQRWLRFRASFRNYSMFNQLMIALQRPDATLVAGYKAWREKHGRYVMRGERGIVILAPMVRKVMREDEGGDEETFRRVVGYRGVRVFDVAQTEGEPLPPAPPVAKITGDSHAHYLPRLVEHAESLGFRVSFEQLAGCEGYCDPHFKVIAVEKSAAANAQLRILIHELIHAHGTTYAEFGRRLAETITDSATYVVCRSLGLDVTETVAQYVSGWSDRETRVRALGFIDHYAAEIERALGLHDRETREPAATDIEVAA